MCLAKKKTKVVKKTLDPTFQQSLMFDESPQGKVLQVFSQNQSSCPSQTHSSENSRLASKYTAARKRFNSLAQSYLKRTQLYFDITTVLYNSYFVQPL